MAIRSSYLYNALKYPQKLVEDIAKAIQDHYPEADGIVVSEGLSGSLIIAPLAVLLNKKFAIVRNKKKKSHAYLKIEGSETIKKYVFVDDIIDTGKTFRLALNSYKAECLGAVFYGKYKINKNGTVKYELFVDGFRKNKNKMIKYIRLYWRRKENV